MPYKLVKAPGRDLWWVVDATGWHYSHEPIPRKHAEAQMRALWAAHTRKEDARRAHEDHMRR